MTPAPMTSAEIAKRLGITPGRFYIRRARLHVVDGMPRPIAETGRPTWDRAGMEAWLTRRDPRRPPAAANDAIAPPMPNTDAEWNRFLHHEYAGGT